MQALISPTALACQRVRSCAVALLCWNTPYTTRHQQQPLIMCLRRQPLCMCCLPHKQEYTFTLTQGDGSRLQGFCRRFLPPAPRVGSRLRYPQVLCLVCQAAWSALFFKVGGCVCVCMYGQGRVLVISPCCSC